MAEGHNKPPYSIVELTEEQHEFLIKNFNTNIAFGLEFLNTVDNREVAEKLVETIEAFKDVRKTFIDAAPPKEG